MSLHQCSNRHRLNRHCHKNSSVSSNHFRHLEVLEWIYLVGKNLFPGKIFRSVQWHCSPARSADFWPRQRRGGQIAEKLPLFSSFWGAKYAKRRSILRSTGHGKKWYATDATDGHWLRLFLFFAMMEALPDMVAPFSSSVTVIWHHDVTHSLACNGERKCVRVWSPGTTECTN